MFRRMVDAALQHAAAMAVGRDLNAVRRDGIVNKLSHISQHFPITNRRRPGLPGCPPERAYSGTSGSRGYHSDP